MNVLFTHADPHVIWPVQHNEHVIAWRWRRFMKQTYGVTL